MPGDHSVQLAYSIPTAIGNGSANLHLSKTGEPLFAQHCDEGGEEGSGQTGVKDGLDVDSSGIGAIPLRKSGVGAGGHLPKRGACDNLKEGVTHLGVIRLELALNVDDESGRDSREQTGLFPRKD